MSIASNLFKRHLGESYDIFDNNDAKANRLLESAPSDELPPPENAPKDLEEVGVEVLECSSNQAKLLKKHGYTLSADMKTAKDKSGKVLKFADALKSIKSSNESNDSTNNVDKEAHGKDKNEEIEAKRSRVKSLVSKALGESEEANIIHSVTDAAEVADDFEDLIIASDSAAPEDDQDLSDSDSYYDEGDADFYVVDDDEETNEAIRRKKAVSYSGGKRHLVSKIVHKLPPKEGYDRVVNRKTGAESYRLRSSSQKTHSKMLASSMHARRARKLARLARQRSEK